MFSKYERKCLINIQIARGKNARQCHSALLEACGRETLPYCTVATWAYALHRGREDVNKKNVEVADCNQQLMLCMGMLRALLEEHRCWTCIGLAREVGIAPDTILRILKKLKIRKICA